MAWLALIAAGLLETVWAAALQRSQGFTQLLPSILAVSGALVSFILLGSALRELPVGTAYVVWVGLGAGGVFIYSLITGDVALTALRASGLLCVVAGVIILKWAEG